MEITLVCTECRETKTIEYKRQVPKFCSGRCRYKNWVSKNRARLNENVRRYRARKYEIDGKWLDAGKKASALKAWMIELKSKPCTDCGETFPVCCMDFDHVKPGTKVYNVGSMFAHHYSREKIQAELDNCELVCSNCHRIRTRDRKTGTKRSK